MVLVSVGDPSYYSSTNTESHYIHKFTLPKSSLILNFGHSKKFGRSMCENMEAFRWLVKGKNVLLLG